MNKTILTAVVGALAACTWAQVGAGGATSYTELYYSGVTSLPTFEITSWTNELDYAQNLVNVTCSQNQTQNVTGSSLQDPPGWSGELAVLTDATVTNSGGPWSFTVPSMETVTYYADWGETTSSEEFNVSPPNEDIWRYADPYWSALDCYYVIGM
jgi:hypothetical protein